MFWRLQKRWVPHGSVLKLHTGSCSHFDSAPSDVSAIKAGSHLGDLSNAIQKTVEAKGYSIVRDFTGHGVGSKLHEAPSIPHYGARGKGVILPLYATIAVEPMVNMGTHKVYIADDDWTVITADEKLSSHYEHTIVVLEDGIEILTTLDTENFIKYEG